MSEAKEIMARTAAKDALTTSLRREIDAKKEEIRILQAESFRARAERDATSARLQQVILKQIEDGLSPRFPKIRKNANLGPKTIIWADFISKPSTSACSLFFCTCIFPIWR